MWRHFIDWIAARQATCLDVDARMIEAFLLGLGPVRRKDRPAARSRVGAAGASERATNRLTKAASDQGVSITRRRYAGLLDEVFRHLAQVGARTETPMAELMRIHGQSEAAPVVSYLNATRELALRERLRRAVPAPGDPSAVPRACVEAGEAWRAARDGLAMLILLDAGLSVSELLALTPADAMHDAPQPWLNVAADSRRAARQVPLTRELSASIGQWLALRARSGILGPTLLPSTRAGRIWSAVSVFQLVRDHLLAIGFDGRPRGPQVLRNTFVRRHLLAGCDPALLMNWLGLETTRTLDKLRQTLDAASPSLPTGAPNMPLDAQAIEQAAELLWSNWHAGTTIAALPAHCRPSDRRDGYAVQSALVKRSGDTVAGWKIAATSAAGQRHIAVTGPLAGAILGRCVLSPSAKISLTNNRTRVAEVEFAFRMSRTLAPREQPFSIDETTAAIGSLHPSVEVPDSRFEPITAAGEAQLIADLACGCWMVIGTSMHDDWHALDLAAHPVSAWIDGRVVAEGKGAAVLGGPLNALNWLANELRMHAIPLRAGEIVSTGTCVVPVPIAPGQLFTADYGPVGSLSVSFE